MMKQWKRLAALSSAIVMAAATLTYFPNDTLQNIRWEISASADGTSAVTWTKTESDGLTWTLYEDGTLTISGTGTMKDYNSSDIPSPVCNNSKVKKIVIEDGVTSIGNYAFESCWNLTSITIPDSVTSIGKSAFHACSSLSSITIPDSVTSIGDSAFFDCNRLTSITISDSVTSIGDFAFAGCSSLSSITIPDSVTSIGNGAFERCFSLTSITIPDSVTSIGKYAFSDCERLTNITISDSVTSIGAYAFQYCSRLTNITIPDSVTSIGERAFSDCSSLTSITIPKSVTSIGNDAFYGCNNLTVYLESGSTLTSNDLGVDESKIVSYWNEDNLTWKLTADGTLTISGTGAMKDYDIYGNRSPVYSNSKVKKIVIEDGVTSIGNSAFSNCRSLTSITIPNSVTSIEDYAFENCSLTNITIPDSVTSIGNYAFSHCFSLTSITIPDSVTSIGTSAFDSCSSLKTISLSCKSSLKKSDFGEQADLVSYTSHTLKKTAAKDATCSEDGNKEYWTCEHCGKYFLSDDANPETAKAVEQSKTVIPASHKLTKVDAKDATCFESGNKEYWTCEHCGKYFLSDDSNSETAKAVELSETVIPALKHKNATTRDAVEPNGTKPGYSGDRYCPDCNTVLEKGYTYWNEGNLTWTLDADGTLNISGTGAMKDYNAVGNLSPATQKKDSVKKVVIEKGVTSIENKAFHNCNSLTSITIPDSVTSIGSFAFDSCSSLTNITIPDSVTSIGSSAFCDCSSLTSIVIPNSVTSIGSYAFDNCKSLTSITIPDSVTSIGNKAFSGCRSLTSITIPDSVTSIGNSAFSECRSLTSITIPDNVTSIGYFAFFNCSSLTSITILDSVTSIGNYAFFNCSSLTSITIPDSVTSIGEAAFSDCTSLTAISLSCKSTLKRSDFGGQADLVSTSHTLKKTAAKAATCTEDGNKEYWTCEYCKKYFLSDDANIAVEQSETVIPALKHKNAITRGASEPTETAPGYSGDRYCPDCDTVLEKGYTYWIEDNLTWKLYADGTLNISGTGSMKDYNSTDNLSPAYMNSSVKKVVIEEGVTNIGNWAFSECSSLTSITIPDSVTNIGAAAFDSCGSLTSITIPGSVTSIESYAFSACSSLTSITIPDSVTSIGNNAFDSCSSLTSITIPDGVTSIEGSAFYNCSGLTSITIPDSVTNIGAAAFENCTSLTSITIPDSVTSIESYAFYNCSGLTSITIPDSVTNIGAAAFDSCTSLKTISLSCKSSLKRSDFGEQVNSVSYASHTLKKTEAKAATYAENGNKAYWTCEHCGKYFLSDDSNLETAKAVELSETVIPALVQVATATTPIKCVYGQDMSKIDLRNYVKNTDVVGEVTVKVATGSTLPDGMKLDGSNLSGKPAKAYEDGKEVTFTFTAENGSTANLTLLFLVEKADPTVEVAVSGDSHTEGDLVRELKLILSENSTKGVVELVSEIKTLVAGKNTFTWKFTPEDENNYNMVTGTVVVNAQTTTTTTTTKATTTTTTKATTTTTTIPSYGDVNLDGKVDILDAVFLNKYLATLIQFSDAQMANADCCQDGVLNDQDTTALMQFIILLIDDLPVQPTEK